MARLPFQEVYIYMISLTIVFCHIKTKVANWKTFRKESGISLAALHLGRVTDKRKSPLYDDLHKKKVIIYQSVLHPCTRGRQRVAPTEDVNGSDRDKRCQLDGI